MTEIECPICRLLFFEKAHVHDHFKRDHPVEFESISMIRNLFKLFDWIGWPA